MEEGTLILDRQSLLNNRSQNTLDSGLATANSLTVYACMPLVVIIVPQVRDEIHSYDIFIKSGAVVGFLQFGHKHSPLTLTLGCGRSRAWIFSSAGPEPMIHLMIKHCSKNF